MRLRLPELPVAAVHHLAHAGVIATTWRGMEASGALETSLYQVYRFAIGELSCLAVGDTLANSTPNRGRCCLLVRGESRATLVDAGGGSLAHPPGHLLGALRVAGVDPDEVDTVVLTHAHPGHAGGVALPSGEPAFPQARVLLARAEWEFWIAEPDLRSRGLQHLVAPARQRLLALERQIELLGHGDVVTPGVRALAAPGHTPGHLAVSITSGDQQLLALGDVLPSAACARHPRRPTPGDLLPEQALATRLRLLDFAEAEGILTHAFHLPFPALGYARPEGEAWRWEALTT